MQKFQVAYIGLNTLFGKTSSLLLKQSSHIKCLKLYDDKNVSSAFDVSQICTNCKVRTFLGKDQLDDALHGADVVIIGDEASEHETCVDKVLHDAAGKVINYARAISKSAPEAIIILAASPLNILFPLLTKTLIDRGTYNSNKVFGCTAADVINAKCILANHLKVDPKEVDVPVIGGSSEESRVPLLSHASPNCPLPQDTIHKLIESIKNRNKCMHKTKGMPEAINRAYANIKFLESVFAGLRGEQNVIDITMSKTDLVPGVEYFSLPVVLGKNGISSRHKLPNLTSAEEQMLTKAVESMLKDVNKATSYLNGKTTSVKEVPLFGKYQDDEMFDLDKGAKQKVSVTANNLIRAPKGNNTNLSNVNDFSPIDFLSTTLKNQSHFNQQKLKNSRGENPVFNCSSNLHPQEKLVGKEEEFSGTKEEFLTNGKPLGNMIRLGFGKKPPKSPNPIMNIHKKNQKSSRTKLTDKHVKVTSSNEIIGRFKSRRSKGKMNHLKQSRVNSAENDSKQTFETKLSILQRLNNQKQHSVCTSNDHRQVEASSSVACMSATTSSSSEKALSEIKNKLLTQVNHYGNKAKEPVKNQNDIFSLKTENQAKSFVVGASGNLKTTQIVLNKENVDGKKEMAANANVNKVITDVANQKKEIKDNADKKKELKDNNSNEMNDNASEKKELKNNPDEKIEMTARANEKHEMKDYTSEKKELKNNPDEKIEMTDSANEKNEMKDNASEKKELKNNPDEKIEMTDNEKNEMKDNASEKKELKNNPDEKIEMMANANEMKDKNKEIIETQSKDINFEADYLSEQNNENKRKVEGEARERVPSEGGKAAKSDRNKQSEKVIKERVSVKPDDSKTVEKPNIFKKEVFSRVNDLSDKHTPSSLPSNRNSSYYSELSKKESNYLMKSNSELLSEIDKLDEKLMNLDKTIRMEIGISQQNGDNNSFSRMVSNENKIRCVDVIRNKSKFKKVEWKSNFAESRDIKSAPPSKSTRPLLFLNDTEPKFQKTLADSDTKLMMKKTELRRLDVLGGKQYHIANENSVKVQKKKNVRTKLSLLIDGQSHTPIMNGNMMSKENELLNSEQTPSNEQTTKTCSKNYHISLKISKRNINVNLEEDNFQKQTESDSQRKIPKSSEANNFNFTRSLNENSTYFDYMLNSSTENNSKNVIKTENQESKLPKPKKIQLFSSSKRPRDENLSMDNNSENFIQSESFESKLPKPKKIHLSISSKRPRDESLSIDNNSENLIQSEGLESKIPKPKKIHLSTPSKRSLDENLSIDKNSESLIQTESLESKIPKPKKIHLSTTSKQSLDENLSIDNNSENLIHSESLKSKIPKSNKVHLSTISKRPRDENLSMDNNSENLIQTESVKSKIPKPKTVHLSTISKRSLDDNLSNDNNSENLIQTEGLESKIFKSNKVSPSNSSKKIINENVKSSVYKTDAGEIVKDMNAHVSLHHLKKLNLLALNKTVKQDTIKNKCATSSRNIPSKDPEDQVYLKSVKSVNEPHFVRKSSHTRFSPYSKFSACQKCVNNKMKKNTFPANESNYNEEVVKNEVQSFSENRKPPIEASIEAKSQGSSLEMPVHNRKPYLDRIIKGNLKNESFKPHFRTKFQFLNAQKSKLSQILIKSGLWKEKKYDNGPEEQAKVPTSTITLAELKNGFFKNKSTENGDKLKNPQIEKLTNNNEKYDKDWFIGKKARKQIEKARELKGNYFDSSKLYQNLPLRRSYANKISKYNSKVGTRVQYKRPKQRKKEEVNICADICSGTLAHMPSTTSSVNNASLIDSLNAADVFNSTFRMNNSFSENRVPNLSPEESLKKRSMAYAPKKPIRQFVFDNLPLNEYNKENNFPSLRNFL